MRFSIAGKVYSAADLDQIRLADILLFEEQTRDFGRALSWGQVNAWAAEIDALETDEQKHAHPGGLWLMAVTIWASRRLAGEPVTFEQAVNFPMAQLVPLPDPADHPAPANPTRARTAARKASAPASGLHAAAG